jgi:hypothetical protein
MMTSIIAMTVTAADAARGWPICLTSSSSGASASSFNECGMDKLFATLPNAVHRIALVETPRHGDRVRGWSFA